MRYSTLFILFFLLSCNSLKYNDKKKETFSGKGFAYIYNQSDYENKIINFKADNDKFFVGHNFLKTGTSLILINPENNKRINIQVSKKIKYPDFYKILITRKIASILELDEKAPFIEIVEIKKNKSFVAKKSQTFIEERQISNNAPVEKVEIKSISKNPKLISKKPKLFTISVGDFYSNETVLFIKKRMKKEIPSFDTKKLKSTKKKIDNKIRILVTSGPYSSINALKDDYIFLKQFGFEDLGININE